MSGRLGLPTALTFASLAFPINAITLAIGVYLPRHYASHIGVDLALVGSAFFLVRMIDIPAEGFLGYAMDRTRSSLGRYRLWVLLGAPIFMLGVWSVFIPPEGVGRTYLITWLLVMYLGNSIMTLAFLAWATSLAPKYDERSRLFGVITAVGVLGAATMIGVSVFRDSQGQADAATVPTMGLLAIFATPLVVALAVWRTPERVAVDHNEQKLGLSDYLALLTRPSFARLLLADICVALGPGWMAAIYLFFFTDSRGFTTGQASILLGVYILAGIVGAPLMSRLAMRISKHRTLIVACIGYSLTLCSFMLWPRGNLPIFLAAMFFAGFLASSFTTMTRAMTADIADEVRLDHGRERAGLLFALTTMTNKISGAMSIGLTFTVLSSVGYVAKEGAQNTPHAIRNLELVYLIGPVFFVTLAAVFMIGYKLTAERHAEIRRQLDARDAQYDEAAVLEPLTGEGHAVAPQA